MFFFTDKLNQCTLQTHPVECMPRLLLGLMHEKSSLWDVDLVNVVCRATSSGKDAGSLCCDFQACPITTLRQVLVVKTREPWEIEARNSFQTASSSG